MDRIPAANRIVAEYEFPYLAHTPMKPLNITIRFDGDAAEAWVPSQMPTTEQVAIAEVNALVKLTGKRYRALPLVTI